MIARLTAIRLRLIDAVALAAVALLLLKGVGWVVTPAQPELGPDGFPKFARVITHARSGHQPLEVQMTGATPAKDAAGDAAKGAAREAGSPATTPLPTAPAPKSELEGAKPNPFNSTTQSVSATERQLLERLGARREELGQKSRDLEMRERLIEDAERRLDERIQELKAIEEKAQAQKAQAADEQSGVKSLVTMYETMKPKEAARVFDRLSHDVLVPVVVKMNPRKMAEVLAAMAPEAAEKLTIALAQRGHAPAAEPRPAVPAMPSSELPAIEPAPRP